MADAYSLTAISQEDDTENDDEDRKFLKDFILERNWQGGGSYFSFYGVVKETARQDRPLKVAGIEYHSPGYIEMVGDANVLERVVNSIEAFRRQGDVLEPIYKSIYGVLKKERLLRASRDTPLSSDALNKFVVEQSIKLASMVGLPEPEHLLRASNRNVVVFAKVILSFTRRIRDLAVFYEEGRVSAA